MSTTDSPGPVAPGEASSSRVDGAGWRLSVERKLPLSIAAVLSAILALTLLLTYLTLSTSARSEASKRLQSASHQLATLSETSINAVKTQLRTASRDPVLARALRTQPRGDGATGRALQLTEPRRILAGLLQPGDSGRPVELWNDRGERLAWVGSDVPAAHRARGDGVSSLPTSPLPHDGLRYIDWTSDSVQLGGLYENRARVYFWIVAPIVDRGRRIGYLTKQYRLGANSQANKTVRALTGDHVTVYYRNADGSVWGQLSGEPALPPVQAESLSIGSAVSRAGIGRLLAYEELVGGTPLVVRFERPLATILATPRGTILKLMIFTLFAMLAGIGLSWMIARRITRPLAALTAAAEAIAAGDYAVRVTASGSDELARLATSFNRMASEIGESRQDLQRHTDEIRVAAQELERSNVELETALAGVEEREAQFRALADAIPQLSWMARADGSVFWLNERWYSYTGTTAAEMLDWGWQSAHESSPESPFAERWKTSIAAEKPFEIESRIRAANGEFRWFLTRTHPVRDRDGQIVRWFGTNTDVQTLRDALDAAGAAQRVAEAANRAKSDFLATMSHELRTPLNAIGGYTELLALELRGPLTDAQRRDLERIRASQQHLLGLIGGVLDLSRIEMGRVTYKLVPIALHPFLSGIDALVGPQATSKSLRLEYVPCPDDLAGIADHEKLRQILLNLLSNAIRYTEAGGSVTLAAGARGTDFVAISVRDTGVGIPEDKLDQIFEPFVQLDRSLTLNRDGVGLGLSISRDLARGMGGELSVESQLGRGSCFELTLARGRSDEALAFQATGEMPTMRIHGSSPAPGA